MEWGKLLFLLFCVCFAGAYGYVIGHQHGEQKRFIDSLTEKE